MRTIITLTPEEICSELGERCRKLRLARNLSQAELAAMTASSLSSIRRLESKGQGTMLLLLRVAQALQVTHQLDSLFVLPIISIADAERNITTDIRHRASHPRNTRNQPRARSS